MAYRQYAELARPVLAGWLSTVRYAVAHNAFCQCRAARTMPKHRTLCTVNPLQVACCAPRPIACTRLATPQPQVSAARRLPSSCSRTCSNPWTRPRAAPPRTWLLGSGSQATTSASFQSAHLQSTTALRCNASRCKHVIDQSIGCDSLLGSLAACFGRHS